MEKKIKEVERERERENRRGVKIQGRTAAEGAIITIHQENK